MDSINPNDITFLTEPKDNIVPADPAAGKSSYVNPGNSDSYGGYPDPAGSSGYTNPNMPGGYTNPAGGPGRHSNPADGLGRYPNPGGNPGYPNPGSPGGYTNPAAGPGRYSNPGGNPGYSNPADPSGSGRYPNPVGNPGYSNPGSPGNPGRYTNPAGNPGYSNPADPSDSGRYPNPAGNPGYSNPADPSGSGRYPNPAGNPGYSNPGSPGNPGRYTNPAGGPGRYPNSAGGPGNAGFGGGGGNFTPGSGTGYMDPPPRTPASVQAEIRRTRHNKEIPFYIALIVLGAIASIFMLFRSANGNNLLQELLDIFSDIGTGSGGYGISYVVSFFLLLSGMVFGILSIAFLFATFLIGVYQLYANQLAYSVRVSETNFPEIYAKVREYSWLLGWKKEPEVYVQQMNGEVNAFTSWVPGKVFLQLNAEIVDLAYMENKDFDTIFFVMAHEFGHAYLHHVQLYYSIWPALVAFIPVIGPMILSNLLSRAREYSADRVAQALTGGVRQEETMMLLSVGRHAYKYMNVHEYLRNITSNHNIVERFARWCINLTASHPIVPYRVSAILDPSKKSGRIL